MSYPIVEQIAQQIVLRLQAVTIANGYQVDIGTILRPTRLGNVGQLGYAPTDMMAVLEQADRTFVEDQAGNPDSVAWKQVFLIALYRISAEGDTVPLDQKINVFQADVEKAITLGLTPTANWQQFLVAGSPLAIDSHIEAPAMFGMIDTQVAGVTVNMAVTYRTPVNDPYTAIG